MVGEGVGARGKKVGPNVGCDGREVGWEVGWPVGYGLTQVVRW